MFTDINMPTRIFEYLSRGIPVVAPRTLGIRDYFEESNLIYFQPDDAEDLANRHEWALCHPGSVQEVVQRGQVVYQRHLWSNERQDFLAAVGTLVNRRGIVAAEEKVSPINVSEP